MTLRVLPSADAACFGLFRRQDFAAMNVVWESWVVKGATPPR